MKVITPIGIGLTVIALAGGASCMASARLASPAQSGYASKRLLVETDWVAPRLKDGRMRIVDMRDAKAYAAGHIPGAVHIPEGALRYTADDSTYLPPPAQMAELMSAAGIGNRTHVVAYDDQGGKMAARLWYVLNAHGHSGVSLLNGGWTKWTAEGRPVTTDVPAVNPAEFRAKVQASLTCPTAALLERKPGVVVLDTRSSEEFRGEKVSPGTAKAGRVPGSVNVDWQDNLTPQKTFKSGEDLRRMYEEKGITPDKEIISLCASGGRASHTLFALKLLGYPRVKVYYGSFGDYSRRVDVPIEK